MAKLANEIIVTSSSFCYYINQQLDKRFMFVDKSAEAISA
jgi:hypothetical protein